MDAFPVEIPSEIICALTDSEWRVVCEQLDDLSARYAADHPRIDEEYGVPYFCDLVECTMSNTPTTTVAEWRAI